MVHDQKATGIEDFLAQPQKQIIMNALLFSKPFFYNPGFHTARYRTAVIKIPTSNQIIGLAGDDCINDLRNY